jgi:hypothetical protein
MAALAPVVLLWLGWSCLGAAAEAKVFRAGACALDVTPTNLPVIINGGFLSATANGVTDPLHARCLVLEDGETRVGLCVLDTCLIPRELADRAKAAIREATGLAPERIMISATHTHFAPSLMQALGTDADPHYPAFLVPRLAEGFRRALSQLEPARVGWTVARAPESTHCRVWVRRPDRVETDPFGERTVRANMHPGYKNPEVIAPSGPSDPDLALLSVQALDGRPLALLANFGMHYHGGHKAVSADYYGRFAERVAQLLGATNREPPFVGIMSQGFSGDQQWFDYSQAAQGTSLEAYAEALARIAAEACQRIHYRDWAPLAMRDQDLVLATRQPDEKRVAWARGVIESMAGRQPRTIPEVYAREQLWLKENPTRPVKLQVLRVGELGLTMTGCEVFAITSLKLKAQSPLQPLMNIELANAEEGYIPPPANHYLGGYNTWSCRSAGLEVTAEPKIIEALLGMLESASGQQRRKIEHALNPYDQQVLKAEPLAYWRLNELSGPRALDATRHQRPASYENGVVFYLEGPGFDPSANPASTSRAAHFAGGRLVAPVGLPGPQYSLELWVWNGLPASVRGITGYLLDWGDRLALGGTNGAPGRLVLSAGGRGQAVVGSTEVPLKTWTHVALTRDRGQVAVFVNGHLDLTAEAPPAEPAAHPTLFIGGRDTPEASFEGRISAVAIYDRALGAAEVRRHLHDADHNQTRKE